MKNRTRIRSHENVVTNASVEMLGSDGEYHDVRTAVANATVILRVGEISRVHLDLVTCDADLEAYGFTDETLDAFAASLTAAGWTVAPPEAKAADPA